MATDSTPASPPKPAYDLAVDVNELDFTYTGTYETKDVLHKCNMSLAPGSRCLLIGANGAGKSTLLRILGGKHLTKPDEATDEARVKICGKDAFRDLSLNMNRAYLDTNWGLRTVAFAGYGCPLQADIEVGGMMEKLQSEWPERRDELMELLGVDPKWRMHQVSDGQRRRVQIFLGLIRPFDILLLDEVTTALDVVVRQDLLMWLQNETETKGSTIVYATHIFDGLDHWPTHLHYLHYKGVTGWQGKLQEHEYYMKLRGEGHPSPMLKVVEKWLRDEIAEKKRSKTKTLEAASGEGAFASATDVEGATPYLNGGGFAPGRMFTHYA